ncbi:MFS transporter [Pseudomonas umsongensis]|uniref:MFS transporter n=1 Tax=Pseudomonas umsongensis TaxID=198618 RepID=UPI00200A1344|nr:MFS transporter [Pseudomonas umsongensis]MCK8682751.1 MFS transporter [Pseudomonas umsongensis]
MNETLVNTFRMLSRDEHRAARHSADSAGLFMKSVAGEFGWSRTDSSIILSTAAICNTLVMPLAGYLVDRLGAARVAIVGTVLGCGSYMCLSLTHSFGTFVAITALSVVLGNLASYPAFLFLTQRWFDKQLGLAFAITSSGLAVGTGGFSYLISQNIELHGWREVFVIGGAIALVSGLVNLAVFVRDNNKGPIHLIARRFGRLAYARIIGSAFSVTLVGAIIGPIVLGMVFDKFGSYHMGLMLFPGSTGLCVWLALPVSQVAATSMDLYRCQSDIARCNNVIF